MKVSDVMNEQVESVTPSATIKDVSRIIFGRGINGVPVCKNKKVIGFITEHDIVRKFFPSMEEFIDDPVHSSDFEGMEKRIAEILSMPVEVLMSKNPTSVTAHTPLLRAQSLMQTHKVGRLPVVDEKDNLIGIIAQGDIFRTLVGGKLPLEEEESFYDWIARYYDSYIDWKKRLNEEIPDLVKVFKRNKVKKVIDVASSTGEHVIALAREGYEVVGIEPSRLIYAIAERKKSELPDSIQKRITFINGKYEDIVGTLPTDFDAAIFLGNALPHVMYSDKQILKHTVRLLSKNGIYIFQIDNFEKSLKLMGGFRQFMVRKVGNKFEEEFGFLTFYTKGQNKTLLYNVSIFDSVSDKWSCRGIHSTPISYVGTNEIESMLKKVGFNDISLHGGLYYTSLFDLPFKSQQNDWLNVIARR